MAHADAAPHNLEGEFEYADTDFAVWKIHYHFYVLDEGDKVHLDLHMTREANGLNVELESKAEINNFIQQWAMNLGGGHLYSRLPPAKLRHGCRLRLDHQNLRKQDSHERSALQASKAGPRLHSAR